ncbi:STAS domain-containing protein [Sorangium sp. So ce854]|uniref:STAS domain-containing protein n=1 Tax=Sorangium sp. So ce854 TaxID=3133322 RepID=UPI003F5FA8FB
MDRAADSGVYAVSATSRVLDRAAAERLRADLLGAAARGARAFVVDLGAVEAFDPIGLSVLLTTRREVPAGARVALAALRRQGQAVARAMRLHEVFDIYADAGAAAADLSR